jgi:sterol desaturase/sphingolipid hydroxylase (fatty acid hydroxylase superfamily)
MNLNPIVLSIPVFFILIGMEVVWDRFRNGGVYRFADALTNISCGITEQVSGVFFKVVSVALYYGVYEHFRFTTLPINGWSLLGLFLLVDFCYYWAHRWSHEVNIFWAGHVVHHQSEYYNLSVALRQGALQKVFTAAVYAPLALLGFHPYWFLLLIAYNTLYQFWIHTQYIHKMGWLEYIFNTPSHHRVHHGRNPEYIDKNHAGSLIVWDKLFGTFEAERAPVVYGITAPVNSWNPVYAQVAHLNTIAQDLRVARGWRELFLVLFGRPGRHPAGAAKATNFSRFSERTLSPGFREQSPGSPENSSIQGYSTASTTPLAPNSESQISEVPVPLPARALVEQVLVGTWVNVYVLIQYLVLLAVTTYFLFKYEQSGALERIVLAVWIFATSATLGMLLEKHNSARFWEGMRFILTIISLFFMMNR